MGDRGHKYTVELRIFGKTLDPDAITRETGLQPCQTRLAGSQLGSQTFAESMWAFDGNGPTDWNSLEEGLEYVLDQLGHNRTLFAEYRERYDMIWWCGHFQRRFDGGPSLSGPTLAKLGVFGVELFIDNYFSPPHVDEQA
jgi:Domain of unknown function (DUF4279)